MAGTSAATTPTSASTLEGLTPSETPGEHVVVDAARERTDVERQAERDRHGEQRRSRDRLVDHATVGEHERGAEPDDERRATRRST